MKRYQNLILLALVALLVAVPLWMVKRPAPGPDGAEVEIFAGADGQARDLVGTIAPSYKPRVNPLMEPASGEIESMLFALQAALGAGFIGYWLGSSATRTKLRRSKSEA
ncbi:energy-coupling factor ABC transporter substrate-binding protein [Pelobacter propionicus]|uniref:Cobalt transport protein CbiN n=1 Tax=Pelobacter propionicus (strain DSM 2379 / NBRC 103807 / OttBd1) TaxID=338966 RepID=A1ANE1_PELPD|nr:energy-coupling factor ABC transporter substrate-binding protein [Pelobacter propionicus]ABK98861.1 Cobalt transport protein CbiN [Pelobacter propionicus DSM 2379]